jgi:RsiW-degrading membrane proteinase PrsW (M82 family)
MDPLVIAAGIIPMLFYPLFLYWMDRYEKEPIHLLIAVFLWGFVPAAILSLLAQLVSSIPFLVLDDTGQLGDMVITIAVAPLTEELFKGAAVLLIFFIWRNEFDGVFDGIIYGGLVGFGFAAIENILYFSEYGLELFFMRAVLFGLNHAFFTSLTGIGFGVARHTPSTFWRYTAPLLGLVGAMSAHGLHNACVTLVALSEEAVALLCLGILADWGGALIILVVMIGAIRQERQWIIDQLRDEVGVGTLTQAEYDAACSPISRISTRLQALTIGKLSLWWQMGRYFHVLTELAYKKHAFSRRGEAGAPQRRIDDLRSQSKALSEQLQEGFE